MFLTLPILPNSCSLYECFDLFSRPENILDVFCPECKKKGNATKKISIWECPQLLIIALKRFKYHGGWRQKLNTMVDFPVKNLNLENYAINKPKNVYNLYATSNHSGNLGGGHYTAICRNFISDKWFEFNDENVNEIVSFSTLHSSSSYILFYSQNS